jgi:hypothetical protein
MGKCPHCGKGLEVASRFGGEQLFVRPLSGYTIVVRVILDTTPMLDVKRQIELLTGLRVYEQRLIFAGRAIADDDVCQGRRFNIPPNATLHVVEVRRGD